MFRNLKESGNLGRTLQIKSKIRTSRRVSICLVLKNFICFKNYTKTVPIRELKFLAQSTLTIYKYLTV